MADGIRRRHSAGCASRRGRRCDCRAGWEAFVFSPRDGKKIRKTFPTFAAAKAWRSDALGGVRRGTVRVSRPTTVRQAAEALVAGMRTGLVRTRSGDIYKPSVVRSYESSLRLHILPDLGGLKLQDVQRRDVQHLADELLSAGHNSSTIRNALMPLRVIYRRALEDGDVAVSPCIGLRLPAVRGRRERIASPAEAATLIEALERRDRALWATAFYAGLRLGELRALRWENVDLASGIIRVEHALDSEGTTIAPKSRSGRRIVPIVGALRELLLVRRLDAEDGYVFGKRDQPFSASSVYVRARRAWNKAGLRGIGLHEARHTCASVMIAAGVNAKAITHYLGHSSIEVTFDLYGHLMPGNEVEAVALIDAYLERANTVARLAALGERD
jgi:integrase